MRATPASPAGSTTRSRGSRACSRSRPLGAVVATSFQGRLDSDLRGHALTPSARVAVARERARPLVIDVAGVPRAERPVVRHALVDASVHAFRLGIEIGAVLALLGGILSLLGIQDPRRADPAPAPIAEELVQACGPPGRQVPLPETISRQVAPAPVPRRRCPNPSPRTVPDQQASHTQIVAATRGGFRGSAAAVSTLSGRSTAEAVAYV